MNGLDDMYLFRNVVDCGGLSAAARRLGVPKSTVSRRIGELESQLGIPLFHRGARKFVLTNFGSECYEHCARMALEAEKVFLMAERSRLKPAGFLHVICPPVLGSMLVESLAAEFAAASPDLRLHLEETVGVFDPRTSQADLVIYPTFNPLPDASVVARKIFSAPYMLVAHPDLFEVRAAPSRPDDLTAFDCLGLGARGTEWVWALRRGQETLNIRFEPRFSTTLPSALLQAARRRLGVASLPLGLCREPIARGELVRVLEHWSPRPIDIYAIYPSPRTLTLAARHFLDFLVERLPALLRDGPRAQP